MPKVYLEKIEDLETYRQKILRAERDVLKRFYDENFAEEDKVLEIGCGIGFLKRNVPMHKEWIQLDVNKELIKRAKELNPEGDYILGSAYALPFVNGAFDSAVGFNSFDVFEEVDKAIKETYRTLKPAGLFVHMLDVHPASTLIKRELEEKEIDFFEYNPSDEPSFESKKEAVIYFIPPENKKNLEEDSGKIPENIRPEDTLKKLVSVFIKNGKSISLTKRVGHFERILSSELEPHFGEIKIDSVRCFHEGKRLKHQKGYGYAGVFSGDFENRRLTEAKKAFQYLYYILIKAIAPNCAEKVEPSCTEVSTIRYIKARKR